MKKSTLLITTLLLAACSPTAQSMIENYDDCVAAGNPVMESYPRQCKTEDGKLFVQDIGNELEKDDLIRIIFPRPNQTINTTVKIRGEARGTWFFEANFPIVLEDDQGNVLAQHYATAQGDWMTENFVAFDAEFEVDFGEATKGNLILKKSNPSDLKENDDSLIVPVKFTNAPSTSKVTLFFYSEDDLQNARFDSPVTLARTVPDNSNAVTTTLHELFRGPTEQEMSEGARTTDDLKNLGTYYKGIGLHSTLADPYGIPDATPLTNVAVINFKPEALEILNSSAARQMMVKAAIETTLRQFPTVDWVFYAIDGKVFIEWDA
ncbi:MAG: GerMN domain-containing protein [Kiritimatiellales bacterium]|nr:GerMN domain-containing protein [Kiritimatiellales bacterium]